MCIRDRSAQVQWTILQNLDATKTYNEFLDLVDGNGNNVATAAAAGSNPSQPWIEGQVQTSSMTFTSFPNGTYSVVGGICDTNTTGESSPGATTGCVPFFGTETGTSYHYVIGTLTIAGNLSLIHI